MIVPETTVPFFNSIVTDSLLSFIKNLREFRENINVGAKVKYKLSTYLTSFILTDGTKSNKRTNYE